MSSFTVNHYHTRWSSNTAELYFYETTDLQNNSNDRSTLVFYSNFKQKFTCHKGTAPLYWWIQTENQALRGSFIMLQAFLYLRVLNTWFLWLPLITGVALNRLSKRCGHKPKNTHHGMFAARNWTQNQQWLLHIRHWLQWYWRSKCWKELKWGHVALQEYIELTVEENQSI